MTFSALGRSSSLAECPGDGCHSTASNVSQAGASPTARRAVRRRAHTARTSISSAPATRQARRRCSSTHARSVTLLCRSDTLGKSMSRYLIDRLATRANIAVRSGAEVAGVDGEASLEAIDVRDRETGAVTRLSQPEACSSLSVPMRKQAGFRTTSPSIRTVSSSPARTSARRDAGHWIATPTSSKQACRESLPAATSGLRRSSASLPRSARAASADRIRPPVRSRDRRVDRPPDHLASDDGRRARRACAWPPMSEALPIVGTLSVLVDRSQFSSGASAVIASTSSGVSEM